MIKGGLGNQMSQYAFYLAIRKRFGGGVAPLNFCFSSEHNGFELKYVFSQIKTKFKKNYLLYLVARVMATKKFGAFGGIVKKVIKAVMVDWINEDYNYDYNPTVFVKSDALALFYLGGWHCEKYYADVISDIKEEFKFDLKRLNSGNLDIIQRIMQNESVSIHFRCGDYHTVGSKLFGGVCDHSYFTNAIEKIKLLAPKCEFYIFSDDPTWVRNNFKIQGNFIDNNKGRDSWQDMLLMSSCKHNIISNSSFSWWSAWLNQNPEKIVICPSKFIASEDSTDVYPEKWIRV